ncbi:hypothetical protein [Haloarchaeobius amylolyticus]|uniref:hypothetical protein n=1 Tax=Haloarchaeobius amylolyticus TaxID=1198296 RepID=UPI00226E6B20|nr:hypothetical protein [Haloarchaeobius amylolyticus]
MTADGENTYDGVIGAFPYALRASDSRLFKLYALLGGLLGVVLTFYFGAALAVQVANTLGTAGGTFTFLRSFYIFFGLLVVAPILAPVLFVARRHRREGGDTRYDLLMAVTGFVFLLSLYLALVISMPAEFTLDGETVTRPTPSGLFAPVVSLLYEMPPLSSPLPPLVVGVVMLLLGRRRNPEKA